MTIFKKKQAGHQPQTKIEKRISTLSTSDLLQWCETSMYTIGKHLNAWSRGQSPDDLEEVVIGSEVFYAIAKELKRRSMV